MEACRNNIILIHEKIDACKKALQELVIQESLLGQNFCKVAFYKIEIKQEYFRHHSRSKQSQLPVAARSRDQYGQHGSKDGILKRRQDDLREHKQKLEEEIVTCNKKLIVEENKYGILQEAYSKLEGKTNMIAWLERFSSEQRDLLYKHLGLNTADVNNKSSSSSSELNQTDKGKTSVNH
jgi:hypothetical protein